MKITQSPVADALLQQASMSDLFFNYDCSAYAVARNEDVEFAEAGEVEDGLNARHRAALMADAEEFAETLRNATGIDVVPSELVEDYLARE